MSSIQLSFYQTFLILLILPTVHSIGHFVAYYVSSVSLEFNVTNLNATWQWHWKSYANEMWALGCCWGACQISERSNYHEYKYHGFDPSPFDPSLGGGLVTFSGCISASIRLSCCVTRTWSEKLWWKRRNSSVVAPHGSIWRTNYPKMLVSSRSF